MKSPLRGQKNPPVSMLRTGLVPSLVRELIIALLSMGDNLRDSVKRYAFITARTLRTPDHNTISYYRFYTELYTEMENGVIVT